MGKKGRAARRSGRNWGERPILTGTTSSWWLPEIMTTLYGIKNCDTMKKARIWLDAHKVAYGFHDYKAAGIDKATLEGWARKVGWETLLNRAGTTFRKLPEADRDGLDREEGDRPDAGAAVDDQAPGSGPGRQADGRLQAGGLRPGLRQALSGTGQPAAASLSACTSTFCIFIIAAITRPPFRAPVIRSGSPA